MTDQELTQQAATPFGRWVLDVMQAHRVTYRSQRIRTGVPHSTVVNWVQGVPPRMEAVIQFARAFGEDVNQALQLAGYEPIAPDPEDALRSLAEAPESEVRGALGRISAQDRERLRQLLEAGEL
ncbi:MAG TPA: hypothetical protein VFU47_03870 [Armatimonadota bacterium]|nr:hypothetical protein [Armatimonadota bacterium]